MLPVCVHGGLLVGLKEDTKKELEKSDLVAIISTTSVFLMILLLMISCIY